MRLYVTTRFSGAAQNKEDIEELCSAVRAAGMEDFVFVRDVEGYEKVFDSVKDVFERAKQDLIECDALLVDVTDKPSGGRVIEVGMAFALGKPVFVIIKKGFDYKEVYDGVATEVISYDKYSDITDRLSGYVNRVD